jgi:hypothetical protein
MDGGGARLLACVDCSGWIVSCARWWTSGRGGLRASQRLAVVGTFHARRESIGARRKLPPAAAWPAARLGEEAVRVANPNRHPLIWWQRGLDGPSDDDAGQLGRASAAAHR